MGVVIINIAVIDADLVNSKKHRFPNLACMKISGFEKEQNNNVTLKLDYNDLNLFDKVYISKVFTDTYVPENILTLPNVVYGGTGFFYDKAPPLDDYIEHHKPDYHLYDEWVQEQLNNGGKKKNFEYYTDYSLGFTTRGCFRKCSFCVNQHYNKVVTHSPVDEFLDKDRKYVCLLDDNILGFGQWRKIFEDLIQTNKPFQFKQGMDERILTEEKCEVLFNKSKYRGDYIFAFDNIEDKHIIEEKAKLIRTFNKNKGQDTKFYVLCAFDKNEIYDTNFWIKDIKNTFERIYLLSKYNFKPYIMRYQEYKKSPFYGTYVNLACWCNQPHLFSNLSYEEFCKKDDLRKSGGNKTSATWRYYDEIKEIIPNDTFKIVPKELKILY